MTRPTILVADDHAMVREGLVALLHADGDVEVVGEASDGEDALAQIEALRPDVAILDLKMPKMSGVEVARRAREAGLATAVVILTGHGDAASVLEALAAGASGYVVKEAARRELGEAIRTARAGEVYLSPRVVRPTLDELRAAAATPSAGAAPEPAPALTPRERDVLRFLARGLTSKEVGAALGIHGRTVDVHRAAIMQRLGIHHLAGLVKYAIRNRLASVDD